MEGRLVQLDFSAAFDRVSHCGLLYDLRSIGVSSYFQQYRSSLVIEGSAYVWMGKSVGQLWFRECHRVAI